MKNITFLITEWVKKHYQLILKLTVLGALVYFPLFLDLDSQPMHIWDEARLAVNAYEMDKTGNFIVPHYENTPDMWSTKPPLMLWCQVAFIKLIGFGELAIRLPSAFAALFICIIIFLFSDRFMHKEWLGITAILVLLTTNGFIAMHAERTGDYDVPLTLFTTFYALSFFTFIESKENKYLTWTFLGITLAVLTKSVSGLLFLPALFLYALFRKSILLLLKSKTFYINAGIFILVVAGFYLLREHYNPGYLKAVWQNELGGRYLHVIENHKEGIWFYYDKLLDIQFKQWHLLIPAGLIIGFTYKDKRLNRLSLFLTLLIISYLLIISFAQTKLTWYDIPVMPFMAMAAGIFFYWLFNVLNNSNAFNRHLKIKLLPYLAAFLIFVIPYHNIIDKIYLPERNESFYQMSYLLQEAEKGQVNLNNYDVCYDGYNGHITFYLDLLRDKGMHISYVDKNSLKPGEKVIANQDSVENYINENYSYKLLKAQKSLRIYKIIEHCKNFRPSIN